MEPTLEIISLEEDGDDQICSMEEHLIQQGQPISHTLVLNDHSL